ncbi:NLR, CARD domain-containing protein 3 [Phytophthora pseudosyringae]|uniref:NLR, CARD domain-containing protein 3 n=1 Tax=Phytophthora pseudosyringae TaxID=221518 RepID=A0A8T1WJM6_9STRA|nr:NLR, CARD domain-containing protein 3 [Phytophthora pseudosyringae]
MSSKRSVDGGHASQLPPVPHHNSSAAMSPTLQSPTRFRGRMSWEKGMLDTSVGSSLRSCKDTKPPAVPSTLATLAELVPSPTKHQALASQPNALRSAATLAVSYPSPTSPKKQSKAGSGSRPMTIEESYDEVEKLLEEHRRQRKEQKPHRVEAFNTVRHTFVFAPLDDSRMLSEMAAQEAADAREVLSKGESEMDMEHFDVGGSRTKLKYFGPEARTAYYRTYRELHSKPQLFVDRETHAHHHRGSLRSNSSVSGLRRSTNLRRSLPTLEQAQISVGGGDMNLTLTSSVPRSPRALFLGACLAGGQTAPTLLLRREHNKRAFDFSHQGLGDNFIVRFAACLPELPLVECINVCDNRLTDAGVSCLLRALENKPHLTSLDVSSNPMAVDAASVLRGYIRSNLCTLRVLALNEVSLSDREGARLAKALEHNKSIDRLLLRGNQIGLQTLASKGIRPVDDLDDEEEDGDKPAKLVTGGQALGAMLTANITLQQLDLSWNQLRAAGSAFIATALSMNYQLRELDLSYNSLGNKGALSLAHALRAGARLRRLTLSYNGISPRGGVGLASGLAVNSSLSMLVLDGNPLGAQGGKALMHASCAPRANSSAASSVCQLSLLDCSLNVSAPTMSAATGDEQLHVFNPTDPAGSYVLDLSDAYEHMVAHELLRLAVSHPGRYNFTRMEFLPSTPSKTQVTKLEMVKCRIQPSSSPAPEDVAVDNSSSSSSGGSRLLNPVAMLFRRLDEDGSGSVEIAELLNALRSCGLDVSDEQLVELVQKYDYDKSGALHKREFADLFARVGFAFVDSDGSGSLDVEELRRVFQLLGVSEGAAINDAIARMIAKYDLDGSGEIDAYEFLEFMTSEVLTVHDDPQTIKDLEEAKLMRLEPCEVGSGAVWQIPNSGHLTADLAHSGGSIDAEDMTNRPQEQQTGASSDGFAGESHRPSDSVLMPDAMLSRLLVNASSVSRNITEQTEFLDTVLAESGMYLSASQGEQLLTRQGAASSAVRPGRRLAALAKLLPRIIDHREAASLVTRIVDIHNQWLERLALRRWLGTQLYSVMLGPLTNAYSFDLTRDDHRVALHRLALVAQEEKQFSRWRSGRGDTSQSGNWENFRWATLDGEPVLLSSTYILNQLLGPARGRTVATLLPPASKLVFYYVSTTRPPRGTKPLSRRRFEQLVAVLAQPPSENEISALCEDRHDQDQDDHASNASGTSKKKTQALLHWELLRRYVMAHAVKKQKKHTRRSSAGDTMNRLANTVEGLQQKLQLLDILVADRWLSCAQVQELVSAFPNAVRARARAACLAFSRIVDLENFIQIYDRLSLDDQEECVRRLGWLNLFDPLQPDRQYPPLDLSIYDERELVQLLAQLALQEGNNCWQNASYRPSITSAGGEQVVPEATDSMSVLPPPGWGRPDAVGPDSVKHHGAVCLRYHSEDGSTSKENDDCMPQQRTDEAQRDAERFALRDRVLCGSRLFL